VRIEEQVDSPTRARAPEVGRAATLPDKLAVHWKATDREPTEATRARLLAKLTELEEAT
jgi:hypothetical protein